MGAPRPPYRLAENNPKTRREYEKPLFRKKKPNLPQGSRKPLGSLNQVAFLFIGLTPSVDGRPNFLRRSESEPLPKSGRPISISSDIWRTSPTAARTCGAFHPEAAN